MFEVGKRRGEGNDPGDRGLFLFCVAPGSRAEGGGGKLCSKTIQLYIRKNFLSLRTGLETVSSPIITQLEQGGLTWGKKEKFLCGRIKTMAWKVPEASANICGQTLQSEELPAGLLGPARR